MHILSCWKKIKFLFHDCFVEIFHGVIENFGYRPFKLRIYQELLTWVQLSVRISMINFVEDNDRIDICWLDRKTMLGVFLLS